MPRPSDREIAQAVATVLRAFPFACLSNMPGGDTVVALSDGPHGAGLFVYVDAASTSDVDRVACELPHARWLLGKPVHARHLRLVRGGA